MLVDTLFDLELTADILPALRQATPAAERITTVVNTHANGDRCYGNALFAGAGIVASTASAGEMAELPASVLAEFMRAAPDMGDTGAFLLDIVGADHFDGIELVAPTRTFTGELELSIGDRPVRRRRHHPRPRRRRGVHRRHRLPRASIAFMFEVFGERGRCVCCAAEQGAQHHDRDEVRAAEADRGRSQWA